MTTRLVRAGGTALLVGTVDGQEYAVTLSEVLNIVNMYFYFDSTLELQQRAAHLLQDYLLTEMAEAKGEAF